MFVILDIKFRFANIKWGLCQNTGLCKYTNFHAILSLKLITCKYV